VSLAVGVAGMAGAATPARADSPTQTYTFSNSSPILYEFCLGGSPGCSVPRKSEPYPSAINVAGVTGHVVSVTVTLRNLTLYEDGTTPMEAELQGPSGTTLLMAGAGGSGRPQGSNLTFAGGYPALTDATISGTYAPTVFGSPAFPTSAPFAPAATGDLSQFVNQDPNGAWNLWLATTDTFLDGAVGDGWQLNITTTPYANTTPIALNAPPHVTDPAEQADPYPSSLAVSGLSGVVDSVRPTLAGFNSVGPDDLDFLLADPASDSALVMADAGGTPMASQEVTNLALTFDDAAPSALPDDTQLFGGVFRPSVFDDGPPAVFPPPAPSAPYPSALSTFAGRDPNGTWNLYGINDESYVNSTLSHGWDLDITTRPASPVQLSASAFDATRGSPLAVTITRGAPATGPATVDLSTGGGSAVAGTDYTSVSTTVSFARGETTKTVTIPISSTGAGGTFDVTLASPTDDAALATPASATVTVPGRNGGGPPGGAPVLSSLRISPAKFRAAHHGASVARRAAPVGTTISYHDSQPATAGFKVEHRARGVRRGRACVPRGHRRAHGHLRRCTLIVVLGTFHHTDIAGSNRFRFTGRVRGHPLARGRYTLLATPRNAAGRSGAAVSRRFQIA
jgi:hypothetical protein